MKKYIGNILVRTAKQKVNECFNKCLTIDNIDKTLPTLIIGLENARKFIENFNILKKSYNDDMLCWTFSKSERRVDYDKDIINFYNLCINKITKNIEYFNIKYTDLTYNKTKKLLNYIKNSNYKTYYIDNNKFVFIYDVVNSKVYGFSLSTAEFFGMKSEKIINLLKKNQNFKEIKNFYTISNKIRILINDDIPSEMALYEYFY